MSLFSFFGKKNAFRPKPDWSPFNDDNSFELFIKAVESNLKSYDYQIDIDNGMVNVTQHGIRRVLLLPNLAKKCLAVKVSEYDQLICKSINGILPSTKGAPTEMSLNEIRDEIGVRILPAYIFKMMSDKSYLGFNITDDLFCFFIRDGEQSVVNLSEQQIKELRIPLIEVFSIARANIRDRYPYEISVAQKRIYLVKAAYYYAPNILLDIGQFPELLGKYGSLVIVPCGATALVSPINDFEVTQDVIMLSAIAHEYHSKEPDPVSRNIYWFYNEEYTLIPFDYQKRNFDSLPQNFLQLLKTLHQS